MASTFLASAKGFAKNCPSLGRGPAANPGGGGASAWRLRQGARVCQAFGEGWGRSRWDRRSDSFGGCTSQTADVLV